jgi:hypothetical protein
MPGEHSSFKEKSEILYPVDFEEIARKTGEWNSNSLPVFL